MWGGGCTPDRCASPFDGSLGSDRFEGEAGCGAAAAPRTGALPPSMGRSAATDSRGKRDPGLWTTRSAGSVRHRMRGMHGRVVGAQFLDPDWYFEHVLFHATPGGVRTPAVDLRPVAVWDRWWDAIAHRPDPLVAASSAHGFVLSVAQLDGFGVSRSRRRNEIRQGRWTAAGEGFLAPFSVVEPGDGPQDSWLHERRLHALRTAARFRARPGSLVSGRSAATLRGLPTMAVPSLPELTDREATHGRLDASHLFAARVPGHERSSWYGIDVESVGRTLVTLARHSRRDAIMAADAALREDLIDHRGIQLPSTPRGGGRGCAGPEPSWPLRTGAPSRRSSRSPGSRCTTRASRLPTSRWCSATTGSTTTGVQGPGARGRRRGQVRRQCLVARAETGGPAARGPPRPEGRAGRVGRRRAHLAGDGGSPASVLPLIAVDPPVRRVPSVASPCDGSLCSDRSEAGSGTPGLRFPLRWVAVQRPIRRGSGTPGCASPCNGSLCSDRSEGEAVPRKCAGTGRGPRASAGRDGRLLDRHGPLGEGRPDRRDDHHHHRDRRARAVSDWPSSSTPARAATAGSSDISSPKAAADRRRSATSSSEYGRIEDRIAMPSPPASTGGSSSADPPCTSPDRQRHERADAQRDREPVQRRERLPDPLGREDVARPARPGDQHEHDADRVDVVRVPARREQHDPAAGEHDPQPVQRASRPRDRHRERTGELDRHRDAQRQPVESLVERPVHRAEDQPVRRDREPVRPRPPAQRRTRDQHHDQRRDAQPQQHGAGRTRPGRTGDWRTPRRTAPTRSRREAAPAAAGRRGGGARSRSSQSTPHRNHPYSRQTWNRCSPVSSRCCRACASRSSTSAAS